MPVVHEEVQHWVESRYFLSVQHFLFIIVNVFEEVADSFLVTLPVYFINDVIFDVFGDELAGELLLEV